MFQFPTGWNSTPAPPPCPCGAASFNSQRDGILPVVEAFKKEVEKSFNSQRDGILPQAESLYGRGNFWFQFPTGWNSTHFSTNSSSLRLSCFNSQRDGILPQAESLYGRGNFWFQFPTGWNSTHFSTNSSSLRLSCFNSQRDGILPIRSFILEKCNIVSIPNGMEFYLKLPLLNTAIH